MIDATFRCRKCSAVLFTGECLVTPVGTAAYSEDGSPLSTSSVTIAANKGPFDSVHHPNPSSLSATITSAGFSQLTRTQCELKTEDTLWYISEDRPPLWVQEALVKAQWTQGKLHCPRCSCRLGMFDFLTLHRCSCQKHLLPPIRIIKQRVDTMVNSSEGVYKSQKLIRSSDSFLNNYSDMTYSNLHPIADLNVFESSNVRQIGSVQHQPNVSYPVLENIGYWNDECQNSNYVGERPQRNSQNNRQTDYVCNVWPKVETFRIQHESSRNPDVHPDQSEYIQPDQRNLPRRKDSCGERKTDHDPRRERRHRDLARSDRRNAETGLCDQRRVESLWPGSPHVIDMMQAQRDNHTQHPQLQQQSGPRLTSNSDYSTNMANLVTTVNSSYGYSDFLPHDHHMLTSAPVTCNSTCTWSSNRVYFAQSSHPDPYRTSSGSNAQAVPTWDINLDYHISSSSVCQNIPSPSGDRRHVPLSQNFNPVMVSNQRPHEFEVSSCENNSKSGRQTAVSLMATADIFQKASPPASLSQNDVSLNNAVEKIQKQTEAADGTSGQFTQKKLSVQNLGQIKSNSVWDKQNSKRDSSLGDNRSVMLKTPDIPRLSNVPETKKQYTSKNNEKSKNSSHRNDKKQTKQTANGKKENMITRSRGYSEDSTQSSTASPGNNVLNNAFVAQEAWTTVRRGKAPVRKGHDANNVIDNASANADVMLNGQNPQKQQRRHSETNSRGHLDWMTSLNNCSTDLTSDVIVPSAKNMDSSPNKADGDDTEPNFQSPPVVLSKKQRKSKMKNNDNRFKLLEDSDPDLIKTDDDKADAQNGSSTTSKVALKGDENVDRDTYCCSVCLDCFYNPHTCHPCNHVFCDPCLRQLAKNASVNSTKCPLCRELIKGCTLNHRLTAEVKGYFLDEYLTRQKLESKTRKKQSPLPGTRTVKVTSPSQVRRSTVPITVSGLAGICCVLLCCFTAFIIFFITVSFIVLRLWDFSIYTFDTVRDLFAYMWKSFGVFAKTGNPTLDQANRANCFLLGCVTGYAVYFFLSKYFQRRNQARM